MNQLWMELRPPWSGAAVQAVSQTPEVPVLKGATRLSWQKQAAYVPGSAVGCAGGTQAPLAS